MTALEDRSAQTARDVASALGAFRALLLTIELADSTHPTEELARLKREAFAYRGVLGTQEPRTEITPSNPTAEHAAVSVNRALRRVASLGIV